MECRVYMFGQNTPFLICYPTLSRLDFQKQKFVQNFSFFFVFKFHGTLLHRDSPSHRMDDSHNLRTHLLHHYLPHSTLGVQESTKAKIAIRLKMATNMVVAVHQNRSDNLYRSELAIYVRALSFL